MFDGFWGKGKKKEATSESPPQMEDGAAKFTLPHLRNIHSQLMKMKSDPGLNEVVVVESLRVIAEMVVYGDKKCELLFDFFCEKNMLALFLEIMRAPSGCPTRVNIQILQTLSILCQCVRHNTSIYYLLSNNYINEIIDFPYDFEEEDGVCDNFISFMKSLSLRLNSQTVQFFFVEEEDTFPLLSRAIGFLRFKDPMVRTAAQATILNVLRISEERSRQFSLRDDVLQAFASEVVQAFESQHSTILALCLEYCAYTSHPKTRELTKGKVGNRIEDQLQNIFNGLEDWLYYLQDLFSLYIPKLTYVLTSQLTSQYIYPVLLDPFTRNQQWKLSDVFMTRKLDSSPGKQADPHNNIPSALNMDYFSKHAESGEPEEDKDKGREQEGEDAPSELSREDSSVSLIVSMYLMNQILDVVRDKRLRRSIMVALLHPFSQQQRKLVLNRTRQAARESTPHAESESVPESGSVANDRKSDTEGDVKVEETGNVCVPHKGALDVTVETLGEECVSTRSGAAHTGVSTECAQAVGPAPLNDTEAVSLLQIGFNSYRGALGHILSSERDRFSLLACLLLEKFVHLDVAECYERSRCASSSPADTVEYAVNAVEPLALLGVCAPTAAPLPLKVQEEEQDEQKEQKEQEEDEEDEDEEEGEKEKDDGTTASEDRAVDRQEGAASIDGHEAWLASVQDSMKSLPLTLSEDQDPDQGGVTEVAVIEEDEDEEARTSSQDGGAGDHGHGQDQEQAEADGAHAGAARNGRRRGRSEDLNSGRCYEAHAPGSGLENVMYDADGISVKGLGVLAVDWHYIRQNYESLEAMRLNANPNNCELDMQSILGHVLNLFGSASLHSLALLQTASVVTYEMACLAHHAHKPAPDRDLAAWRCPADILESKAAVLFALRATAKSLLLRANGWLSDTLLSQLEEEIRRSLGGEKRWVQVLHKIGRNRLLVLPPTSHLSKRLGLDHATPTSQVESSRRELQTFLLLRSLYLCLSRLSSSPFAQSSPQDLSDSLVDEFIHIFSEHGGSSAPYLTGTSLEWGAASEPLAATVLLPPLPSSPSSSPSKSRTFMSSKSSAGAFTPPPHSSTFRDSSADSSVANGSKTKSKLSPIPKLMGNAVFGSGEKPRRTGEVVFIRDESTLLLAVPDPPEEEGASSLSGVVLLAVPLHRTDVVSADEDSRNVKLLVRSPVPIASMACLSSPDSGGDGPDLGVKMASVLSPRCPGVLYQMVIGFESKEVCDGVIKFIETQRLLIQSARTESLKEMLGAWVDTTV